MALVAHPTTTAAAPVWRDLSLMMSSAAAAAAAGSGASDSLVSRYVLTVASGKLQGVPCQLKKPFNGPTRHRDKGFAGKNGRIKFLPIEGLLRILPYRQINTYLLIWSWIEGTLNILGYDLPVAEVTAYPRLVVVVALATIWVLPTACPPTSPPSRLTVQCPEI